jgi:hypothetical protein
MSGAAPSVTLNACMLSTRAILPSVRMTSSLTSQRKRARFNLHRNRYNRGQGIYQTVETEPSSYEDLTKMWNCFICKIITVFEIPRYVGACHKDVVSPRTVDGEDGLQC